MSEEQVSIEETLKSIRELMSHNFKKNDLSDDEILELTEDDLFDEEDEDAYYDHRIDKKEENKSNLNENLTQNLYNQPNTENVLSQDSLISTETAVQSIAAIKRLIKKVEHPAVDENIFEKDNALEEIAVEAIKPLIKDWLDEHLPSIVEKVVEKEVKNLIPKKR
jgi:uncharacterized protein